MLLGLNYMPECSSPVLNHIEDQKAMVAFKNIQERANYLNATLPSQYEYLTNVIKSQEQSEYLSETDEANSLVKI
jgi:tryptophan halogenase